MHKKTISNVPQKSLKLCFSLFINSPLSLSLLPLSLSLFSLSHEIPLINYSLSAPLTPPLTDSVFFLSHLFLLLATSSRLQGTYPLCSPSSLVDRLSPHQQPAITLFSLTITSRAATSPIVLSTHP
jgi:hypothetical protein